MNKIWGKSATLVYLKIANSANKCILQHILLNFRCKNYSIYYIYRIHRQCIFWIENRKCMKAEQPKWVWPVNKRSSEQSTQRIFFIYRMEMWSNKCRSIQNVTITIKGMHPTLPLSMYNEESKCEASNSFFHQHYETFLFLPEWERLNKYSD